MSWSDLTETECQVWCSERRYWKQVNHGGGGGDGIGGVRCEERWAAGVVGFGKVEGVFTLPEGTTEGDRVCGSRWKGVVWSMRSAVRVCVTETARLTITIFLCFFSYDT